MKKYAVGIDLGGTMIKYAIVSSDGEIVFENTCPTPVNGGAGSVIDALARAVADCVSKARSEGLKLEGVGIGTPGVVSSDGRRVIGGAENIPGWENIDIASGIEKEFRLPVVATNDANAMAYGEFCFGASRDATDVVFITVGTGIGGAVLINGSLWRGYESRGMELGHITVKADGDKCACGGYGCLEHYASTIALIRRYLDLSGEEVDGRILVQRYLDGDRLAIQAFGEHWMYLGHGIASIINIFAPQYVVVGGGISEAGDFYMENLRREAYSRAMDVCSFGTKIIAAELGNKAGCLGAGRLAIDHCLKSTLNKPGELE